MSGMRTNRPTHFPNLEYPGKKLKTRPRLSLERMDSLRSPGSVWRGNQARVPPGRPGAPALCAGVQKVKRKVMSIRGIARESGTSRVTVRKCLDGGSPPARRSPVAPTSQGERRRTGPWEPRPSTTQLRLRRRGSCSGGVGKHHLCRRQSNPFRRAAA